MADLTKGQIFAGRYEVQEQIGKGGTRSVYSAKDLQSPMGSKVALKVLHEDLRDKRLVSDGIMEKTKLWIKAAHPALIAISEVVQQAGARGCSTYWVTELAAGDTLRESLTARRLMNWKDARPIFLQSAGGIDALHTAGLIHCDLKPSKILLGSGVSSVKVLETSLLRTPDKSGPDSLEGSFFIGTPGYACPETASGIWNFDHRSDIYSFGIMMYETLSGAVPFKGNTPLDTLMMHKKRLPEPLDAVKLGIPRGVVGIVMRALEKLPDNRYQSMEELREAILRV